MQLYPELEKLKELVLTTSDTSINVVVLDGSIGVGKSTFARSMLSDLAANADYNSIEFKDNHLLWLILSIYPKLYNHSNVNSDHFSIRVEKRLDNFINSNIAGAVIDLGDTKEVHKALDSIQLRILKRFPSSKNTFYIFVVINTKTQREFFESYKSSYSDSVKISYLKLLDWDVRPEKYSGKFIKVQTGVIQKCELINGEYKYPSVYSSIPEELLSSFLEDESTFCRDMLAL